MAVPCNPHDFQRFTTLATMLSTVKSEISVYVSTSDKGQGQYVSLELKGILSNEKILEAFGISPTA